MTKLKNPFLFCGVMCTVMLLMTSAQAAMVSTSDILAESNRAILLEKLERKDVQQQLIEMGVDPESAIKRVNRMTDEEVAEINGQLETLPAGAGVNAVELLLIIIIIILII
ncbi:PA2779 family protein [Kaarinaea lacus]